MGEQIILCDGFEVVPPPEMHDLLLFRSDQSVCGSNCGDSTVTTEEDGTVFSGDSSPGWHEVKFFSFYLVKQHAYDDPYIKSKINEADSEIYYCNKRRIEISDTQRSERAEVSSLYAQMESLVTKSQECKVVYEEKKREFDTLQEGLSNQRCSRSDQLCFSKEELDHLIYIAHYVIEHGNICLEDERWLFQEREKLGGIILSEDYLAQKEASMQHLKLLAVEMNEVKKELEAITWNIQHLNNKMGQIQNKIMVLDAEMAYILEQRDKSYESIKMLRIQRDKGNAAFFQSLDVIQKVKELAASGNVRDMELYASSEVDRFMTRWNNDKAYRDDYVKRKSLSLYERQLSQDGRMRDPECEAQFVWEKQPVVKTRNDGMVVHKMNTEDSSSNSSQDGNVIIDKQKKEARKKTKYLNRSSAEESDVIDMEFQVYENPKKEEAVDEETLKERKREEQLEKARLAMERKRKLQEKAAAKAAVRAQKETEKKLKECEKKAKKRAAANSSPPLESDQSRETINELEKDRTLEISGKDKQRSMFPKQRSFRYKHRGRGTEALPKAILNRRKAHRYWVWGPASAALALALFLAFLLLR